MTDREAFEAWQTKRYEPSQVNFEKDADGDYVKDPSIQIDWEVWQAAIASRQTVAAEPVAWMVGNDPMTAATYNAGDKEKAFDAAKRWNWPITGLSVIAGAPDFDINYQQTKPVGEWRMKNGEPMHVLWRAKYKPQLGDKLYAAPPAVQGEPVALDRWGIKSVPGRPEDYWFEKMPDGYWTPWHIANEALQRAAPPAVQGEPVAWMFRYRGRFGNAAWTPWTAIACDAPPVVEHAECESYPLYAAPPQPASLDVAELVVVLREIIFARDYEAKAQHSLDVAQRNFTSWKQEEAVFVESIIRSSNAEKAARAALAKYDGKV